MINKKEICSSDIPDDHLWMTQLVKHDKTRRKDHGRCGGEREALLVRCVLTRLLAHNCVRCEPQPDKQDCWQDAIEDRHYR